MSGVYTQARESWAETVSGRKIYYSDERMDVSHIPIEDIAHALGNLCRYGGHIRKFYSVAEHSIHIAEWCRKARPHDPRFAMGGLMHDGTEGLGLVDMINPVKHRPDLRGYRDLEHVAEEALARSFDLDFPADPEIKLVDTRIINDERKQGMSRSGNAWGVDHLEPLGVHLWFLPPEEAGKLFLSAFRSLDSRRRSGMPCGTSLFD